MPSALTDVENAAKTVIEVPSLVHTYVIFGFLLLILSSLSFGAGYLYRAHLDEVKDAGAAATLKTATTIGTVVVQAADTHTDTTLQTKLNAATSRAASLQKQIEIARNATPAAVSCALPVSLRDAINADLATDTGQIQASVP